MDIEKKNKIQDNHIYLESSILLSKPDLKISNTKIFHIKENHFNIEISKLILDSIRENLLCDIKNIKTKPHDKSYTNQQHLKQKQLKIDKDIYETIELKAESIMPLTKFLEKGVNKNGTNYNTILHFIGNIGNQLTFLKTKEYSIPFFSLEDFIVINHSIFCFINDSKIFKIDNQTKKITIDYPISYDKNNSFIPLHIPIGKEDKNDQIPIDIYFSSIYYSLAQICVYIFIKEKITDEEDFNKVSGPFVYTPLYWCLKRCLDKDENKRILLYV